MDKESEKVPDEVDRLATHHDRKRIVGTRRDGEGTSRDGEGTSRDEEGTSRDGEHGQIRNSNGREQDDGVEVHLAENRETVEKVETDSCADREKVLKPSPMPDEVQIGENVDVISEQHSSDDLTQENFQTSLYDDDTKREEFIHDQTNTENYITEGNGLLVKECIDDLVDVYKSEINRFGKTFYVTPSLFNDLIKNLQKKEENSYTNIKRNHFEIYDKCFGCIPCIPYNAACPFFNQLTSTVFPVLADLSSDSESENESTENEVAGQENVTSAMGNELPRRQNGIEEGAGIQSTGPIQVSELDNEEPRQEYGANHHYYLSDYGHSVCHPTDEIEIHERHRLLINQPNVVQISNNYMLVCSSTRSREEEYNLGHTLPTTESVNSSVSSSLSNQLQDRPRVPLLTPLFTDFLDGNTTAAWHRDNFQGLPILMANSDRVGFQQTCPLDPGLTILMYQIETNLRLLPIFSSSSDRIFNETLPALLNHFRNRRFEEMRQAWADIIQWRRNSFYGMDGEVMMPPFSGLLQCRYRLTCTNTTCPANNREFTMADDIILSRPTGASLDIAVLQGLINRFEHGEMRPCCELNYHTRPGETVRINPIVKTYCPTVTNSQCTGMLRTERTSVEVPPIIVLNFARSLLRWEQIGDLLGTVEIGGIGYYVGGLTFSGIQHFTARIYLPHPSIQLFYDNLQGIQVEQYLQRDSTYLSLLFLFRRE